MEGFSVGSPDRFAGYTHNHLSQIIGQLDTKVTILLGLASGALVYLVRELNVYEVLQNLIVHRQTSEIALYETVALFSAVFLVLSFTACLYAISPRFGRSRGSIIFYRGITESRSGNEYAAQVKASSADQLTDAVLADAYSLAKIAKSKAGLASWATSLIVIGLPLLIVAAIVQASA